MSGARLLGRLPLGRDRRPSAAARTKRQTTMCSLTAALEFDQALGDVAVHPTQPVVRGRRKLLALALVDVGQGCHRGGLVGLTLSVTWLVNVNALEGRSPLLTSPRALGVTAPG